MKQVDIPVSKVPKYDLNIDVFNGGTNTVFSEARLGKRSANVKFALTSTNLWQNEDGIWETRPGIDYFGQEIPGIDSIDGATDFEKLDGTRETIVVGGGKLWKSEDGGAWTEITGVTFTAGYTVHFYQIKSTLFIANTHDPLAIYDGTTASDYSSMADPTTAMSVTKGSGISASGSYTYYYRFTANNSVGNTNPSPSISITTTKPREQWVDTSLEYADFIIPAVTGAQSFDVWMGEVDGKEYFLGSTSINSFRDFGQAVNIYREIPDDNTTSAPLFGSMEMSGNRMWATGDPNNPWRVYGTGVGQYFGYFSAYYGGFYVDVEKGSKYKPIAVAHYRTGKGDPIITVLCSSADGQGTLFQVELTTITIGDTTFVVPVVYKLVGAIGSDAPLSVIKIGDNIGFLNATGIYFLRNKQQMFNVLAADDMSTPIRNKIETLNKMLIDKACGYFKPPRAFWSFAEGSKNDTTVVFDNERRNWAYKWTVGFKQFLEYVDSNKRVHFLAVPTTGNKLVEISTNYLGDFNQGFYQCYISPLIPINADDHEMASKIDKVIFEIGKLRGEVKVEVLGKTKKSEITSLKTKTEPGTVGNSGWSDDAFSDMFFSDTADSPKTTTQSTRKIVVKVKKRVYALQFKVWSNTPQTFWQLLSIQAHGFLVNTKLN